MPDLSKFGMLGFHRLNSYNNSKKAFKRTHIYSTVLLNLDKLQGVEYHWRAHVMEDIQFNWDADKSKAVLCKCYRFAFSSPQIKKWGCHDLVAINDELREVDGAIEKPALAPAAADPGASKGKKPELLPEKPVNPVNEGSTGVESVGDAPAPMRQRKSGRAHSVSAPGEPAWLAPAAAHDMACAVESMQFFGADRMKKWRGRCTDARDLLAQLVLYFGLAAGGAGREQGAHADVLHLQFYDRECEEYIDLEECSWEDFVAQATFKIRILRCEPANSESTSEQA
jgi:hypothetical protein